jgi:hypothetical protein
MKLATIAWDLMEGRKDLADFMSPVTPSDPLDAVRCRSTAFVQGETKRCVLDRDHDGEHQVGRRGTTPFRWR